MTMFAIERNGSLVNHLVFVGDSDKNLYRVYDIKPMIFTDLKAANEVAEAMCANVVSV